MKPRWIYYSHFGSASDAVKKLNTYATRLTLWGKIVLKGMKNGEDFETICERISEQDPLTTEIEDYLQRHLIFSGGIVKPNVYGFMQYYQRIQKN